MAEVNKVTKEYLPLAQACSDAFFILDEMHSLNHFYQFSLRYFLDAFDHVLLDNPNLKGTTDPQKRLHTVLDDLFLALFKRTARSLLHADHLVLAVLLAQVKLRARGDEIDQDAYTFLLEGTGARSVDRNDDDDDDGLDATQRSRLRALARLPGFEGVRDHIDEHAEEWRQCLASDAPETALPSFSAESDSVRATLQNALVIKCLRPDRLVPALACFVDRVFDRDLLLETRYDLDRLVQDETTASTPLCLVSVPGHDASYRVDALVQATSARCTSVAMGSQEGYALADQAIATAARNGSWVLLKNVHLAPSWLGQLEKRLQNLGANRAFRLFLTMEATPKIPVNILRQGRVLMNEPPAGIRANLLDSLGNVDARRLASGPAEKTRLYFLLAWFHAIVQERLRYAPLGWTKSIEFNDADLAAALATVDTWMSIAAKGRANIDPAAIPWKAIRTLVRENVYGGKIDTVSDQVLLDSFVERLFSPKAYDVDFALVPGELDGTATALLAPDETRLENFLAWARRLPEQEPPSYLALPVMAERVISAQQGQLVSAVNSSLLSKLTFSSLL
jgi:dynein heavy chain 1